MMHAHGMELLDREQQLLGFHSSCVDSRVSSGCIFDSTTCTTREFLPHSAAAAVFLLLSSNARVIDCDMTVITLRNMYCHSF
jgi:hypothetical protein